MTGPAAVSRTGARRERLRGLLRTSGLDALLVTDLINIRYLTGFTGSNAALLVVRDETADDAEASTHQVLHRRPVHHPVGRRGARPAAADQPALRPCAARARPGRDDRFRGHGRSASPITRRSTAAAADAVAKPQLTATVDLVEQLRAVKDPAEIDALRRACEVADRALAELIEAGGIRPGRTEREVGLDLDQRMRMLGASDPSFETIVAAGANSAIPHHRPTGAELAVGDFVKLDFGATVDGYHSDMTRTLVLGPPADWQRDIYQLVHAAQAAGREAALIGATGAEVDAAARTVIADAGLGAEFSHGLGHGVGLQVHEAPSLARESPSTMAKDMCVTVEPGVYLPGRGGVRIEDSGVIRPDGYHVLTLTSRELCVL